MEKAAPRWASEPVIRAVLALAGVPGVILGLVALYAVTADVARVDALSRVLQGAMLAILGFYFGRVGVDRALSEAEEARREMTAVAGQAAVIAGQVDRTAEWLERAEQVLDLVDLDPQLKARLEELRRKMEEG